MSGKNTDLALLSGLPAPNDILDLVDVSNTAQSPEGSSVGLLLKSLALGLGIKMIPNFEGYIIIRGQGNVNPDIIEENDVLIGIGALRPGQHVTLRANKDNAILPADFVTGLNAEE